MNDFLPPKSITGSWWRAKHTIEYLLLVAILLLSIFGTLPASADAMGEYEMAVAAEARGEYYTSILNLRRCLAANPGYVPAYLMMGDVLVKLGKFTDADTMYTAAEQKDPESVEPTTRRLRLHALHLKDFTKAEEMVKHASARFGQNAEIHYYNAVILKGRHSYIRAKNELTLALALREKYYDARKLQLDVESIIGNRNRILDVSTRLLEDFPESVEGYEMVAEYLLRAGFPVEQILDLFSKTPPLLLQHADFARIMARLYLMAERYSEAADILKSMRPDELTAEKAEDDVYLRSLAEVACERYPTGIQILANYLRDVPDRPYLLMQLDLWLIRHTPVSDPLRRQRAADRLRIGKQKLMEDRPDFAIIPLYMAARLNPRDKEIRQYLADAFWKNGLSESTREQIQMASDLDPHDETVRQKAIGYGHVIPAADERYRRTYKMFLFRLSDDATSLRPSFGRLLTDVIALFSESMTPFVIQALEPAVPFEKAEDVAHQRGADFFFHGQIGRAADGLFTCNLGIYPVGTRGITHGMEFKEHHMDMKSRTDFTDDLILYTIKTLHSSASQYAKVVQKEREGYMMVDIGRRHGLNPENQFIVDVMGGPLYFDVVDVYEWFSRIRVQEIERAQFVGIGDVIRRIEP